MKNDGKLDNCPFRGPLFINKKLAREQLLHNNNKNGSRPKTPNKKNDTSNTAPSQAKIYCHQQKLNSVRFEEQYPHIKIWKTPMVTLTFFIHMYNKTEKMPRNY